MPKMKTSRSASKRFKKIASGNYKYKHSHTRHILTKKSTKRKRQLRQKSLLSTIYKSKMVKYLPYI